MALASLGIFTFRVGRAEPDAFHPTINRTVPAHATPPPAEDNRQLANETLLLDENQLGISFRCGPVALSRILAYQGSPQAGRDLIRNSQVTPNGCSLTYLADLSRQSGMNYQMAYRVQGDALPLPAVVHYKFGHFVALIREENGLYLMQDSSNDAWVTRRALEAETDGYFLVPDGELPTGWRTISHVEGETVWGKGPGPIRPDPPGPPCVGPCCPPPPPGPGPAAGIGDGPPPCSGMCVLAIDSYQIGLVAQDNPVGYIPPLGPPPQFIVTYNQYESDQPASFSYSNLGQKWTFNWLAYISDNPSSPATNVSYYTDHGGSLTFTGFNTNTQSFAPEVMSSGILTRTSPNSYQLEFLDGTTYVFAQPTATNGTSRKVFMTQVIDPQGNALQISYDSNFRVAAVTDAIGQVTTLAYGNTNDIFKITQVTDPFGRFASFAYNASNELAQITDCIGLTSQFAYDTNGAITAMTTPYGTSTFAYGTNAYTGTGTERWLELTFPNGEKERAKYCESSTVGVPYSYPSAVIPAGMTTFNQYMYDRNTYFWSRNAYPFYAANTNDYTKAKIYHWYHSQDMTSSMPILEATKQPLENWVWYDYAGQPTSFQAGTSDQPTFIGRVLDDGTTQLRSNQYNAIGNLTQTVDPVGRSMTYIYSANNVDRLESVQTTGTNWQILSQATYNTQHRRLTITDAAGQTTTNTYNARGQLLTTTDPLGETTTLNYATNGYLLSVVGPLPGTNDTMSLSYDAVGRVRTMTNTDGYVLAYGYDNLDRLTNITFPDGTFDAFTYSNLDLVVVQDRLGRQTINTFDSLQQLVASQDPLGRLTQFQYCACGGLAALIDPMGRQTTWERDLQGRQIAKQYPDGSRVLYNYEQTTSRLNSEVDEKGQVKAYSYYGDDNLKSISYPNAQNATPTAAFTYDTNFNRMVSMSDGTGTTTWNYFPVGVLGALQKASIIGPFTNDTVSYQYDALGRVASSAINGVAQALAYDVVGRVTNIVNALGSASYDYDGGTPRVLDANYPNGQVSHYAYFGNLGDHRLQQITHQRADSSLISSFAYAYNPFGDITNWVQQLGSVTQSWSLGYDAADQLLNVSQTGTSAGSFNEAYDPAGNRLSETTNGVTRTFQYNSLNQLVSSSDTTATNVLYQWDAEQRLVGIIKGTNQSQFFYDGLGRRLRIVETSGNVTNAERRFVWGGPEICEEHNANDVVVNRYFDQGEQQNGTNLYYTRDHLGSVRELTDGASALRAEYAYATYGLATKLNGDLEANFGFTGHFRHLPSGLDLTFYRALDLGNARWLSRDPVRPIDVNLYSYAGNDPINRMDPDGGCAAPVVLASATLFTVGVVGGIAFAYRTYYYHPIDVAKQALDKQDAKGYARQYLLLIERGWDPKKLLDTYKLANPIDLFPPHSCEWQNGTQ